MALQSGVSSEGLVVIRHLFLVRHCASISQEASVPLTAVGYAQAIVLADHLTPVGAEMLVSSPSTHAQQSVAPLAQRLDLPVEIETHLTERVLAAEPRMHWREALQHSFTDLDLAWPGRESSRMAMARGRAAINALLTRPAHVSIVVTHGDLMTLTLRSFEVQYGFQAWERLSNPDVYGLAVHVDGVRVSRTWESSCT
jgi:2,3-bisphosphoglycerate-dependent phosphoglycerate mutase